MALPQVGVEAVVANLSGFKAGADSIGKAYDTITAKAGQATKASEQMGLRFSEASGRWHAAGGRFASVAELAAAGVQNVKKSVDAANKSADTGSRNFGNFGGVLNGLKSSASSIAPHFVSIGQSVLNFGAIAGGTALLGVTALTAGIGALGIAALGEVSKFERMSLSIQNLVAREISQGKLVEQQAQARIQLTQKEVAELEKLRNGLDNEANDRDVLTARIQEQKERIRQLTEQYGENGLVVIKERAELQGMELNLADLNSEIDTHNKRISELTSKNGQLTTVLQKVRVGQMSMTEAMELASPRAQELIKWIQMLAIQSPFNSEDIQMAFQTALAYGFTSEQAQRLTEAEVDFIAATGKSAQSADLIALALGQIQARGKLSAQELRQLSEQGVGVNKILEDMGFSLDDVTNGLVPVDKFIEAVIKDMEVFKGAAKEQATTFAGLITSLGEIKSVALREFFTGTFKSIQPYLAQFVDFLTEAALQTSSIRTLGDSLGLYVGEGLKTIANVIGLFQRWGPEGIFAAMGFKSSSLFFAQLSALWTMIAEQGPSAESVFTSIGSVVDYLQANTFPMLTKAISFVMQNFDSFKGALLGIGTVLGAGVFAAIVAGILSLVTPISLIVAGAALLGAAWVGNWGGIQEKTFAVWAVVQPILQQIYDWLAVNIPIAVQFVADAWNNILFPPLATIANWLSATYIPLWMNIYDWIYSNIPVAIQYLSDVWTNTLLPALTSVGDYISTNLTPLMKAMNDFILAVFNVTLSAMAGLWQNIIYPALQGVYDVIAKNLQPVFVSLGDFISNSITPKLDKLGKDTFPMLSKALQTVTRWIKEATNFFKSMANAVNNFKLPEVLQEHSPSPFAMSLIHIADAADRAGLSMQALGNITQRGTFDKLFKIDRSITEFPKILQEARRGLEAWGKERYIGPEKVNFAINRFREFFTQDFDKIMVSENPLATFQGMVADRINWKKIGLKAEDAQALGKMFFLNFFKESEKRAEKLTDMIISGSQQAIQMASQLNQFASQQTEYLQSQVDTLQEFVESGETEMNFEGRIISAAQAQELLNQKLEDQKAIQDDILQIKQQESKLQFLESQLDLIKMVRDAGLNVREVLGGITLGLDASIPDMLAATNNVIQAIIGQVDSDLSNITQVGEAIGNSLSGGVVQALGIASPSKVMQWIAKQTVGGFVDEMLAQAPNLISAIQNTIVVPTGQLMSGIGSTTSNTTNNYFDMNVSTLSSPQAVMQQYQVMRAMV